MYYIGLDIGTTSICGVVFDSAAGKVCESVNHQTLSFISKKHAWESIQDPMILYEETNRILTGFTNTYNDIRGIGLTGQMHGVLYIDIKGKDISPLYNWQDGRGNIKLESGNTYTAELSRITGHDLAPGFGIVTHYYNMLNDIVPENARWMCTIQDYIAMRIADKKLPVMDYTNAASLGLFNLEKKCFDSHAINKAGIDESLLPHVCDSGKLIGHSTNGIPVFSAIGDNQASLLGAGGSVKDSIFINVGTGGQISIYTDNYLEISGLNIRPFPGGGYILVGAPLCAGKSYALLERFFREVCKTFIGNEPADLYEIMNSVDFNDLDRDNYLKINTQFQGTRQNPDIKGSISNISLDNFSPEYLIVGFMDGIALEFYEFFKSFPKTEKRNKTNLIGSGNGLRNNSSLCQAFERMFNKDLKISPYQEEAAVGAAIYSAVGQGGIKKFLGSDLRSVNN